MTNNTPEEKFVELLSDIVSQTIQKAQSNSYYINSEDYSNEVDRAILVALKPAIERIIKYHNEGILYALQDEILKHKTEILSLFKEENIDFDNFDDMMKKIIQN